MLRQLHRCHSSMIPRGKGVADIISMIPKFLMTETTGKVIHGLTGLAGTAALAYGAKRLLSRKDGQGLGPPGYQHTPAHLIFGTPLGKPGWMGKPGMLQMSPESLEYQRGRQPTSPLTEPVARPPFDPKTWEESHSRAVYHNQPRPGTQLVSLQQSSAQPYTPSIAERVRDFTYRIGYPAVPAAKVVKKALGRADDNSIEDKAIEDYRRGRINFGKLASILGGDRAQKVHTDLISGIDRK